MNMQQVKIISTRALEENSMQQNFTDSIKFYKVAEMIYPKFGGISEP